MKTIACSDMGLTCPFIARGETEEAVLGELAKHGQENHPEEVAKMMEGKTMEDLNQAMRAQMKEE